MNQKKRWLNVVALALCGALLLSACSSGGDGSGSGDESGKSGGASSSGDVSSEPPKDYSKYNTYLKVSDIIDDDIEPALSAYFENVDYTEEFSIIGDYGAINEMANATRDEDRAELLEDGEMVLYHSLTMIHTSQDILDQIWVQIEAANEGMGPEDPLVLPEIDMAELAPLFDQVQTAYEDLNGALANEEERSKISSFTGVIGDNSLALYNNKVESLLSWVNRLKTDLTEGTDYAEDFNKMNEAISSMIDGYNVII